MQAFRTTARRLAPAVLSAWLLSLAGAVLADCLDHRAAGGPRHAATGAGAHHAEEARHDAHCCEHRLAAQTHCLGTGDALRPAALQPVEPTEPDREAAGLAIRLAAPRGLAAAKQPAPDYRPPPGVLRPALLDRTRVLRI